MRIDFQNILISIQIIHVVKFRSFENKNEYFYETKTVKYF